MSASTRLAYDDARTPHEMYDDCRAAGDNLHLAPRTDAPAPSADTPPVTFDITDFDITDQVARMAGSLHLHFD